MLRVSLLVGCWLIPSVGTIADDLSTEALQTAKRATRFLTDSVSTQGGYLWQYSADLKLREGEGVVNTPTVWVQPPGTPSVGLAFVELYEATGDQQFLDAALAAAEAMRRGQLRSGGWQASIEFDPDRRQGLAYRTQPERSQAKAKDKDLSTLDDDKTQASLRFLASLDRALQFKNESVHEMTSYGIAHLLQWGQLPNGGFPQVWTSNSVRTAPKSGVVASYPDTWPRDYPGHQEYWWRYTLNDNLASDLMETLFLIEDIYQNGRAQSAAIRLADSLLMAQMPQPQPAWAQQYSDEMQPVWARKFEPPAVSGGESQGVIAALLLVYRRTGDRKYLAPIPSALNYLEKSRLADGQLARFYELNTNRPLYFTRDYELTYDDSDMPTHYGFKVESKLSRLREDYEKATSLPWKKPSRQGRSSSVSEKEISKIIGSFDDRGATVTKGELKYHRYEGDIIPMKTTVANLRKLAAYLHASSK